MPDHSTRRRFLSTMGGAAAAAWCAANLDLVSDAAAHAHDALSEGGPEKFEYFTAPEARTLAAIAATIVPSDDGPGATEAGAIYFMDRMCARHLPEWGPVLREGVATLEREVEGAHPGAGGFAALSPVAREAELIARTETPFGQTVWTATMAGLFSLPSYGGNRRFVGWTLVGQDRAMTFTPPFGYYDDPVNHARLLKEAERGE